MQQAHDRFLIVERTGFYNWTAQHLYQPTANGIDENAGDDACEGVGAQIWDERQSYQPQNRCHFRGDDALAIADLVHKFGAKDIYHQLSKKEDGGYQGDSTHGNAIVCMKFQKQQRCKIHRDRLCYEAQITGFQCSLIILPHLSSQCIKCFSVSLFLCSNMDGEDLPIVQFRLRCSRINPGSIEVACTSDGHL